MTLRSLVADERGQTLVFFVVGVVVFVLLVALVVDVGAWMQVQRKVQSTADAAALAGAQDLPFDQGQATSDAQSYGRQNSPAATLDSVSFPAADTIDVAASERTGGFFSGLAGIFGVTTRAQASARVEATASLKNSEIGAPQQPYVVPLVLSEQAASCVPGCLGQSRTLSFGPDFAFVCTESQSCRNPGRGNGGRNTLIRWLTCNQCLTDTYTQNEWLAPASTGASGGGRFANTLKSLENETLIAPVIAPGGAIDGFAALVITDVPSWSNNNREITAYLTTYTAPGAPSTSGSAATDYGVRVLGLTG